VSRLGIYFSSPFFFSPSHFLPLRPASLRIPIILHLPRYERLKKSICNEIRGDLKEKAQQHALNVFGHNLQRILLTPPLGARKLLAIDPGIRTGCKYAVLSENSSVLQYGVLYPNSAEGTKTFVALIEEHEVPLIYYFIHSPLFYVFSLLFISFLLFIVSR